MNMSIIKELVSKDLGSDAVSSVAAHTRRAGTETPHARHTKMKGLVSHELYNTKDCALLSQNDEIYPRSAGSGITVRRCGN